MEHVITPEWFSGLHSSALLLVVAVSMAALVKGADWLVNGASGLAYRLGVPEVIVGATIVSLGTTSPECAVSVMAAWQGNPGLALGNSVGSIIADSGLIFGTGCLLARLPADRFVLQRQGSVVLGAAALLAALCYGSWLFQGDAAALPRWVGVLLLLLLVGYMYLSVRWARRHPQGGPFLPHRDLEGAAPLISGPRTSASVLWLAGKGIGGLAVVVAGSQVLIGAVTELARQWGVPEVVIAGTIVAFGTSLPEAVVGLTSLFKGHPELLVGNVIGADILNVLFVTGASAVAAPLPIIETAAALPEIFLVLHLPAMLIVQLTLRLSINASVGRGDFRRWYGWPLVMIYAAYVSAAYLLGLAR